MRLSPPSTAQLGTAWLTGAALLLGVWWAFNSWEAQRNGDIQSEMVGVNSALKSVGRLPVSSDSTDLWRGLDSVAVDKSLDNVERLQNETARDMIEFARHRQVIRPLVTIFTVIAVALLLGLTWQWANSRKTATT